MNKLEKKLALGNLHAVKIEKELTSEELDVDDSNINFECQDDFKPDQGTSTRSGNFSGNLRGGFKKSTRGRNRKVGSTKITVSKGRGRRSVLKKQVKKKFLINFQLTVY